jgi:hypothetical protein
VRPLGLRTSPLGCPVSSLLSASSPARFAGRFPVHALEIAEDGRSAQVILGADDKHLVFRSCVAVRLLGGDVVEFELSDRIACRNAFGRFYVASSTGRIASSWPRECWRTRSPRPGARQPPARRTGSTARPDVAWRPPRPQRATI